MDWLSFWIGALVATAFWGVRRLVNRIQEDRLGPPPPLPRPMSGDVARQVSALLADGHKIDAIKLLREETGCDLKTAHRHVVMMQGERR